MKLLYSFFTKLAILCVILFQCGASMLSAAEFRGRVTDAETGNSLTGASVSLDPNIAVEGDESIVLTDPFGFFYGLNLAAGTYQVMVSHPGYIPEVVDRTFGESDVLMEDFDLVPEVPGQTLITIFGQVVDTKSSMEIPGVPVRIRRFESQGATDPAVTFVRVTDELGQIELPGMKTGWYDFRFNEDEGLNKAVPKWQSLTIGKRELNTTNAANARLMPEGQDVTLVIEGFDPARPEEDPPRVGGAYVTLTGIHPNFEDNLPFGFDPFLDSLSEYVIPILPPRTGVTNKDGEVVFKNLPAIPFLVEVQKYGYKKWQEPYFPDDVTGDFETPRLFGIDLQETTLKVGLTSMYTDPEFTDGIPVVIQGLEGTNTAGIRREEVAPFVPFTPDFPEPRAIAEFPGLLPGRYLVSVFHKKASPPVVAQDFALTTYTIGFEGEKYVDLTAGETTIEELDLRVIPATIRGRLLAADEVGGLELGPSAMGEESELYNGPIYKPMEAAGIEFTESIIVDHLPPDMKLVSVDTDKNGNFVARVLPGVYGVTIPSLDGYWGSNYRLLNLADGENYSIGWPYGTDPDAFPPIPIPPFGSTGIPINSSGDYEVDFYLRKQLWQLDAEVTADTLNHPALHRIVTNVPDPVLTAEFSHIAEGGTMSLDLETGGTLETDLLRKVSGKPGDSRFPATAGVFSFTAPPGLHTLSGTHPSHTILNSLNSETEIDVLLPDLSYPGTVHDSYIVPLTNAWGSGGIPGIPDRLTAEYSGTTALSITMFDTNEADERVEVASFSKPTIFTFPGEGDKQFAVTPEPFKMIAGDWTIWLKYDDTWYGTSFSLAGFEIIKEIEFDVIEGEGSPPPELKYKLVVDAVSDADPTHKIPGLSVEFGDDHTFTTPHTESLHDGGYMPLSVSPTTKWVPAVGIAPGIVSYDVFFEGGVATPQINVTLRMKRGMGVKGTVKAENDESIKSIAGTRVYVRNRYGSTLASIVTDDEGAFELGTAITNAQTIYLEVNEPGFYPYKKRISPNNDGVDGTPVDIDEAIVLTPLPAPTMVTGVFDRFGPFLPGVTKSSSGGVLTPDEDLNMSYELKAKENDLTLSILPFDTAAGVASAAEDVEVKDAIKELWIIDPRGFGRDPYADVPMALPPPSATDPLFNVEMRRYLESAVRRTFMEPVEPGILPFQWYRKFAVETTEVEGEYEATGELSLPTLPPGEFKPWIVAVTQRGAVGVTQVAFDGFDANKNLNGVRLPPWAAAIADTLGTAAAVKKAGKNVNWDNFIPAGYLNPLPDISADIEEEDGFLKYSYEVGVNLQEGMEVPGTGIASVIPGFAGLDINGTVSLEIDGSVKSSSGINVGEFSLGGEIVATSQALDITDYIPRALPKSLRKKTADFIKNNASASVIAGGSAELKTLERFVDGNPLEREVQATTTAGIGIPISIDITPVVQSIPSVGPVVTALRRTPVNPTFYANIEDAIGTSVTRSFTTQYPHIVAAGDGGSVTVLNPEAVNHTQRRDFMGGKMEAFGSKYNLERALCMRFGVGLEVEIANGRAGASGSLALTGNECKLPTGAGGESQPALKVTLNRFGDWPPITRIQGGLSGEIEAYLDAWIARFSKSWEFNLIEVDIPFNSEASFDLSPMTITETVYGLETADPADFLGDPPTLVQDLFLPGQVSVSGSEEAVLVFTDVDPSNGEMVLRTAFRSDSNTWSSVSELARSGGIVAAKVLSLPAGGYLAVWTEIAVEDANSMTPSTTLKYALSSDGTTWSSGTLSARGGVASDLRLVPMAGDDVALLFLETDRGPGTNVFSMNGVVYDGAIWGAPAELLPPAIIYDWDAEGPGATGSGDVQIAVVTAGDELGTVSWDGITVSPPEFLVMDNVVAPVDLGCGPDDFFTLAYSLRGGGIGFFTRATGEDWMDRGIVFEGALPSSLAVQDLFDGDDYAYLIGWTDGGSGNVYYGYVDAVGGVTKEASNLTQNINGVYQAVQSVRFDASHNASLLALFDNGETTEVRTFDVSHDTDSFNNDRDADEMDDFAEMHIVDADTTDALGTVDDVLPGDDFDQDGFTNKEEVDAGTDPTHPGSFPGQSVSLSVEVAECFEFGTVPGQFAVIRSGDASSELVVQYSVSGTATSGADYQALSGEITLAPGIYVAFLNVVPEGDDLAEGDETVIVTLAEDAAYDLGTTVEGTVTVKDLPMDEWRLANFTSTELSDPSVTGDDSDADRNDLVLVLEYAFGITPNANEYKNVPVSVVLVHPGTSEEHAGLIYLRPTDALDLAFTVEVTDDLGNWLGGADQIEEISVLDNGDGTETVTVRDKTSLASGGRFIRLTVNRINE